MTGGRRVVGAVLLLGILLASAWWLRSCGHRHAEPEPPAAAIPTATLRPAAAVTPAPSGYRLAGVAVGDPQSFAVVEAPSGANVLYRLDDDIPGLGRLARIEAERIVVENEAGQIELWLMPAASPTPTRLRAATARVATAASRTAAPRTPRPTTPTPMRPPAGGGSVPGSTP